MNRLGLWVSSVLVLLALLGSTLFVVDQRQFGVVYALGQIKEVVILSNEGKALHSEVATYADEDSRWYTDALKKAKAHT